MLKIFTPSSLALLLGAVALTTSACGRIAISQPAPPPPAANLRAPMPTDLAAAVAVARAAVADPDPALVSISAYGVRGNGRLTDSIRSGWLMGFIEARPAGPRAVAVVVDWTGAAKVHPAKLPAGPTPPRLKPDALPPLRQAVAWARAAGLPEAATYQLAFVSQPDGPLVAVAERTTLGSTALEDRGQDDDVKTIVLDATSGRALAPVKTEEAPAEAEPDSAEGAAALTATAVGFYRGR